jgi:hypothetical protein
MEREKNARYLQDEKEKEVGVLLKFYPVFFVYASLELFVDVFVHIVVQTL